MDKDRRAAFSMANEVRDQDNAKPMAQRPSHIRVPAPRLAPLGMSGIRVPQPMELSREATPIRVPRPARELGKPSEVNREFQAIVRNPGKVQGRDR